MTASVVNTKLPSYVTLLGTVYTARRKQELRVQYAQQCGFEVDFA